MTGWGVAASRERFEAAGPLELRREKPTNGAEASAGRRVATGILAGKDTRAARSLKSALDGFSLAVTVNNREIRRATPACRVRTGKGALTRPS